MSPRLVYLDPTLLSVQYVTGFVGDPNVPSTHYSNLVIRDGASFYWKLDDTGATARDSADSTTGTLSGGVTTSAAGLLLNDTDTSMSFDGINGFVDIGNVVSVVSLFRTHDWTVEYWIKPTATTQFVFSCGTFNNAAGDNFLHIGFDGSNHIKVGFFGDDLVGTATLSAATTYHVAVTWSATTRARIIYLNGVVDKADTSTGPLVVPTNASAQIARASFATGNGPFFYTGVIDEVALYGSVLSPVRVAAHYAIGATTGPLPYVLTAGSDGAPDAALQQYVAGQNSGGFPPYTGDPTQVAANSRYINGIIGGGTGDR